MSIQYTEKEAYDAMFLYLKKLYELTNSDDLAGFLGGMTLLEDAKPADSAIMRMNGARSGILHINNPNGVCGYCNSVMRNMLPPGATLTVRYPGGSVSY